MLTLYLCPSQNSITYQLNVVQFHEFSKYYYSKNVRKTHFCLRCMNIYHCALNILMKTIFLVFSDLTCQIEESYPTFKLLFVGSKVFLPLPPAPGLLFVALPPFPWLFPNEGLLLLNCTPGLKGIEANISGLGISMGPVGLFFGPSPGKYVNLSTRNLARK